MIKLQINDYPAIYELYKSGGVGSFFPLIGAVLSGVQDGEVYADNVAKPGQFYVEHCFGFAQIFGEPQKRFEDALENYFIRANFAVPKVRLYAPYFPKFLRSATWEEVRSFRQRFVIDAPGLSRLQSPKFRQWSDLTITEVSNKNIVVLDQCFGVAKRFWRDHADFIQHSNAVVSLYKGQPAAICYAAAVSNRRVEIDMLTLPEFRQLGAGKLAVINFVHFCFAKSLFPLWDCFTNNAGSVQLSRSAGFVTSGEPYPFFTINKKQAPT